LTSGTTEKLISVYFLNDNTGFAGGESSVRMTTNGGINWFQVLTTGGNSFIFINNTTGFVHSGNLFKTTNGGFNWFSFSTGTGGPISKIQMLDSINGIGMGQAVACDGSYNPAIHWIKTSNGGLNWQYSDTYLDAFSFDFIFFDANTGLVGTTYSVPPNTSYSVYRTTNAGASSWHPVSNFNTYYLGKLFKFNETTACGVANMYPSSIITNQTTNKGATWSSTVYSGPQFMEVIGTYFLNSLTGFAAGTISNTGRIIKTIDGGISWGLSLLYSGAASLNSVYFSSSLTGYAVGNSGVILKTTNGGLTGFSETGSEVPKEYSLLQNTPNPFNPVTRIVYELPESGLIKLKVYDALGKEVETLVNQKQTAGSYSVDFNAASLPSGIYFYKIVTEKFSETKKMILVK
jgi:photosystem II stability/assembly factor-like uncharacterized protein